NEEICVHLVAGAGLVVAGAGLVVAGAGLVVAGAGLVVAGAGLVGLADLTSTRVPGTNRSWPSVTTRSPACTPCRTTVVGPRAKATTTGRDSTVESGFTTKTYCPFWPA